MQNTIDHPSDNFLTRAIEELTPENDPESWAAFQRFIAKWQTKSGGQNSAPQEPSALGSVVNTAEEAESLERSA